MRGFIKRCTLYAVLINARLLASFTHPDIKPAIAQLPKRVVARFDSRVARPLPLLINRVWRWSTGLGRRLVNGVAHGKNVYIDKQRANTATYGGFIKGGIAFLCLNIRVSHWLPRLLIAVLGKVTRNFGCVARRQQPVFGSRRQGHIAAPAGEDTLCQMSVLPTGHIAHHQPS